MRLAKPFRGKDTGIGSGESAAPAGQKAQFRAAKRVGVTVLTKEDPQPHSLWLVPAPRERAVLQGVIQELAARYDRPVFAPHVTLMGDLSAAPAQSVQACRECLVPGGALVARVKAVTRCAPYFMSLFLDLTLAPDVAEPRQSLGAALGLTPPPFRPHLSLAYGLEEGQISADHMHQLVADFAGTEILLDSVAVVSSAQTIPIASWQVLQDISLSCGPAAARV